MEVLIMKNSKIVNTILCLSLLLPFSAQATALEEVASRCIIKGAQYEQSTKYHLHIDRKKKIGILVQVDFDDLTTVQVARVEIKKGSYYLEDLEAIFVRSEDEAAGGGFIGQTEISCEHIEL